MNNTKTALYTRTSTNLLDTINQLEENRRYANENSLKIIREYTDDNTTNGSQLEQMLLDVERGLFDTIIVYRFDRLSRTLQNLIKIESLLNQHNIGLVSVMEHIDTRTGFGRALTNIFFQFQKREEETLMKRQQFEAKDSTVYEEFTPHE